MKIDCFCFKASSKSPAFLAIRGFLSGSNRQDMGSPTLAHVLLLLLSIHPILSNANQMEADKIDALPGQPAVDFDQYSGYITVDPNAGRALFYYFVESQNSSTKPLVLWLDGGPACSALGFGAMAEMGPFRVNKSGKSLYINDYAWNKVANVIYLEAPAGTGFSYSNTSSDYENLGDEKNPTDTYTFILNWLERFPQYQGRDLYLAGQSYAGHFVPLLAYAILQNKSAKQTAINLRGIALGNALIDQNTLEKGIYDYYWTHGFISDETHTSITKTCDFISGNLSVECERYEAQANEEIGHLNKLNIYGPLCHRKSDESESCYVGNFDPCTLFYVEPYLNLPEVQQALHAKNTSWKPCRNVDRLHWGGRKLSILPTIRHLIQNGIPIWLYSGDTDGIVPITSTRYAINALKLPVKTAWRAWYSADEVGGFVVEYDGLVLATIRGAGHTAPSYQPERALTMISSFLNGTLPPARTNPA